MAASWSFRHLLLLVLLTGLTACVSSANPEDEDDPPVPCGDFQVFRGHSLFGSNTKTVRSVTVKECEGLCRNQTSFNCLSFDYNSKRETCYMSRESHETRPTNFGQTPSSDYYALVLCVAPPTIPTTQECRRTDLGTEYQGTLTQTASGYTCQRWDSQYPHGHSYNDPDYFTDVRLADVANNCRNPLKADPGGPWCLTSDRDVLWEYCDVDCPDCTDATLLTDYTGQVHRTRSGIKCQRWASNYPHSHSFYLDVFFADGDVETARNYCRNPVFAEPDGPWCFTTDPDVRWERCDVPYC